MRIYKWIFAVCLVFALAAFCGCGTEKKPDPTAAPSVEVYAEHIGHIVNGKTVCKEGDLFYPVVNGVKGTEGYLYYFSALDSVDLSAFSGDPHIRETDFILAEKQDRSWWLFSGETAYSLPEVTGGYYFSYPYMYGETTVKEGEKEKKYYYVFTLYALSSDLSTVEDGKLVAPLSEFAANGDVNGDGYSEYLVLRQDGKDVVYDIEGKKIFSHKDAVTVAEENGNVYFAAQNAESKKYALYREDGTLLYDDAEYFFDEEGYSYLYLLRVGEDGQSSRGSAVIWNGNVHRLTGDHVVYVTRPNCFLFYYQNDTTIYWNSFDGEVHSLPYKNIVANTDYSMYLCMDSWDENNAELRDADFNLLYQGLRGDTQNTRFSDPENGVYCVVSASETAENGFVRYYFYSKAGGKSVLETTEDKRIGVSAVPGYYVLYENPTGNAARIFSALNGQTTELYDDVAIRYENGLRFAFCVKKSENMLYVLDLVSYSYAAKISLNGETGNPDSAVELTQNIRLNDEVTDNAMPLSVVSLTVGGEKSYYAVTRKGAYGKNFDGFKMLVSPVAGEPAFVTWNGILSVTREGASVLYRVGADGVTEICQSDHLFGGCVTDPIDRQNYLLFVKDEKVGIAAENGLELYPAELKTVSAVNGGYFAVTYTDGTQGVLGFENGILKALHSGYENAKLYAAGVYFLGGKKTEENKTYASLYKEKEYLGEVQSVKELYAVDRQEDGSFRIRLVLDLIKEREATLLFAEDVRTTYPAFCADLSCGEKLNQETTVEPSVSPSVEPTPTKKPDPAILIFVGCFFGLALVVIAVVVFFKKDDKN